MGCVEAPLQGPHWGEERLRHTTDQLAALAASVDASQASATVESDKEMILARLAELQGQLDSLGSPWP